MAVAETPVVDLHDAVALLGRFPALAGVSLSVLPGEVVLLAGPNGAGKTTLLRLCAGLVPLHSGRATVLGVDLAIRRQAVRPLVGLLGHDTMLYDDLTVRENLSFWAELSGTEVTQVDAAMDRLGISGFHARPVRALSAGQRRRTSIAATVLRRPQLWLLDEPHASLDASSRDVIDNLVREAVGAGATVIIASHELERVKGLATRVVTVAGGGTSDSNPTTATEVGWQADA